MNMIIESLKPLIIPIDSIKLDPHNARRHPDLNLEAIKRSLEAYGQRKPIVVRSEDRIVEAGNGMLQAAIEMGWSEIAAVMVEDNEQMAAGYSLMDNQSALLAEWDPAILKEQLEMLEIAGFDMELTGFSTQDLSALQVEEKGLIDDDDIPEEVEASCKTRQLYRMGDHRLLCGDCTVDEQVQRLMDGNPADMVFTDPPYNVKWQYRGKLHKERFKGMVNDDLNPEDWERFCSAFISNLSNILTPGHAYYVCSGWNSFSQFEKQLQNNSMSLRQLIIWAKNQFVMGKFKTDYNRQHEQILYGWKEGAAHRWFGDHSQSDLWQIDKVFNLNMVHSTEKPVALAERAIKNSSLINEVIVDLFGGSGSTLIACQKLGRRCYCMEIDPHYCDVIINRWEQFTGLKAELING